MKIRVWREGIRPSQGRTGARLLREVLVATGGIGKLLRVSESLTHEVADFLNGVSCDSRKAGGEKLTAERIGGECRTCRWAQCPTGAVCHLGPVGGETIKNNWCSHYERKGEQVAEVRRLRHGNEKVRKGKVA